MAKATLEFDLDNPDDLAAFNRAVKADAMASCLWEVVHNTWRRFKETPIDYESCWEAINEELENNSIDIDDLWR